MTAEYASGALPEAAPRAPANGRKHTCPQNHPYDQANTYLALRGRRRCQTCRRERTARAHVGTVDVLHRRQPKLPHVVTQPSFAPLADELMAIASELDDLRTEYREELERLLGTRADLIAGCLETAWAGPDHLRAPPFPHHRDEHPQRTRR